MWVFLNNAFLSIVQHPKRKDLLVARARAKGDIERVFPKAKIHEVPNRDYAYRAFVPRSVVATAMSKEVMGIDYENFKNSVAEDCRHTAYARVWGVMYSFQHELDGQTPKAHDSRVRTAIDLDLRRMTPLPF